MKWIEKATYWTKWPGPWSWRAQSHCRGPCSGGGQRPRRRWLLLLWSQVATPAQRAEAERNMWTSFHQYCQWPLVMDVKRIIKLKRIEQGRLRWNEWEWESMTTLRAVENGTHHPPNGGLLVLVLHNPPVHPWKRKTGGWEVTFVAW